MDDMTWWGYVQRTSNGAPHVRIAEKIGVSASAVSRWSAGSTPDPKQAAAFARAYEKPVIEAFIAAGFLTKDEAGVVPQDAPSLADFSEIELIEEVRRRQEVRERYVSLPRTPSEGCTLWALISWTDHLPPFGRNDERSARNPRTHTTGVAGGSGSDAADDRHPLRLDG